MIKNNKLEKKFNELMQILDQTIEQNCSQCDLNKLCKAQEQEKILLLIKLLGKNNLNNIMINMCKSLKNSNAEGYFFVSHGYSMYPAIEEGDILVCSVKNKISKGDIILYSVNNYYSSVHRVAGVEGDMLYVTGDNNNKMETIHKTQYISTITIVIKKREYKELWEWLYTQIR